MEGFKYTPYELGRIAYQEGHELSSNPFKQVSHSLEYLEWNLGWLLAEADLVDWEANW